MNRSLFVAVFAVAVTGCASVNPCLAGPASNPGTERQAKDGVCLRSFTWEPAAPARGVVVIIHGLRDYSLRAAGLAESLRDAGFVVVAQDHRGHGYSGGAKQRFESVQQLVEDVDLAVQDARKAHPGLPLFVFGHSMGGLVATQYTLEHPQDVAGLVLSGPGIKVPASVSSGTKNLVGFLSAVFPGAPAQELDSQLFLHDGEEKQKFLADPLIIHEKLPARSTKALLDGINGLDGKRETLAVPLLDVHGEEDVITEIDGSRELVKLAASADKTLVIAPGQRHDLAHEPDGAKFIAEVTGWISQHAPAK